MPSTNSGHTDDPGSGGGGGTDPGGGPTPPPDPGPDPDPGGTGGTGTGGVGGTIGPDGVIQLFSSKPGGTSWFLNMNAASDPHDGNFNISYGSGSHIKSTLGGTIGGRKYFNSVGAVQNYNSGSPSSRSCRFDIYPGGGQGSSAKYAWNSKPKPTYLYNEQGIRSKEMTVYLRTHNQLKTHESCAFKVNGRDNDEVRSAIEIVYPTATHSTVVVNYNFAHFPYVAEKNIKQIFTGDKLTAEKWVGVKGIHMINDAGTIGYLAIYTDLSPFKPDGSINNQFKLKAECVTKGVSGYNNVVCSWKCQKDVMRVDGFANVDYTLFSDREIVTTSMKTSL